jgi:hypothetical protein
MPGQLRSLLPHIRHIRAFSLGSTCFLTDDEIFPFLGELVCLETLRLHTYTVRLWHSCILNFRF